MTDVLHLAAFTTDPAGGNPAGVVLDASALTDVDMQRIAHDVGHAETAFLVRPEPVADGSIGIRYYSPTAEVPFCGHATIATAVALAEHARDVGAPVDRLRFDTPVGPIDISLATDDDGRVTAAFTSVEPVVEPIDPGVLDRLLALLRVTPADIAPAFPPMLSAAGNTHPVVVLAEQEVFDTFTFDPAAMRALMDEQGWAGTVTVLHPLGPTRFEARNLFPVGTLDEDPATGSAAASTGGYLRALGRITPPVRIVIEQGRHVGRPGLLVADVPEHGGIVVSGTAVVIA